MPTDETAEKPKQKSLKESDPETWALGLMNTAAKRLRNVFNEINAIDSEAAARNSGTVLRRFGIQVNVADTRIARIEEEE